MPTHTRINARAVIQKDDKVLLCRAKDDGYFFFPGGGIEFCEGAEGTLRREMQEELGVKLLKATFIGVVENQFVDKGKPNHELNLVFSVTIDEAHPASLETHIDFAWMDVDNLEGHNVLPKHLTLAVTQWLKDGKVFWVRLNQ